MCTVMSGSEPLEGCPSGLEQAGALSALSTALEDRPRLKPERTKEGQLLLGVDVAS